MNQSIQSNQSLASLAGISHRLNEKTDPYMTNFRVSFCNMKNKPCKPWQTEREYANPKQIVSLEEIKDSILMLQSSICDQPAYRYKIYILISQLFLHTLFTMQCLCIAPDNDQWIHIPESVHVFSQRKKCITDTNF